MDALIVPKLTSNLFSVNTATLKDIIWSQILLDSKQEKETNRHRFTNGEALHTKL